VETGSWVQDAPVQGRENAFHVLFTQDCEQLAAHSMHGGPANWEISQRSTAGLADCLEAQGFRATLFIVAQTAAQHRRFFLDLHRRGHELGLHLHPQDAGFGHDEYLGGLTFDEQVSLIDRCADQWAQALGVRPVTFRGGNFSANDATFLALAETGFRQGSCSSPGRRYGAARALWEETCPWPHHVHRANRLLTGDLEFFEVPITCDQEHRRTPSLPGELRIEGGDVPIHTRTIEHAVRQQIAGTIQPRTIVAFTHNHLDYADRADPHRQTLEAMIRALRALAGTLAIPLQSATVSSLHHQAHQQVHQQVHQGAKAFV
jgi:hypothetical protein